MIFKDTNKHKAQDYENLHFVYNFKLISNYKLKNDGISKTSGYLLAQQEKMFGTSKELLSE